MAYADVLPADALPSPEGALEQYEMILSIDPQMTKARAGAGASRLRRWVNLNRLNDFTELLEATPTIHTLPTGYYPPLAKGLFWSCFGVKVIDVLPQSSPNEGFASGISGWPILPQEVNILEI